MNRRTARSFRRGSVGVALVIVMVILQLVIIRAVLGGGRDQDLTARRMETLRSFYAAEGAMNMCVREVVGVSDYDGDGTIGEISDDGNANNDPTISLARAYVTSSVSGGTTTFTAKGRYGSAVRCIKLNQSTNSGNAAYSCSGGTITVDTNVTINFNNNPPTYTGDADLQPYFTYDISGATADTWKAIFTLGAHKLLIKNGATITLTSVPAAGSNRRSPGIEITGNCDFEVEAGGVLKLLSSNELSGNLSVQVAGGITNNGEISNTCSTSNPVAAGDIILATYSGDITTGNASIIEDSQRNGLGDIVLAACGPGGDISISGLVRDVFASTNGPYIKVCSLEGTVTLNGTTLYEIAAGTSERITTGLDCRNASNASPKGTIRVQSYGDMTVVGNYKLTSTNTQNYGAVRCPTASASNTGGTIDARSMNGKIIAQDRSFDNQGRFNSGLTLNLAAKDNIQLTITGSVDAVTGNTSKPVVNNIGSGGASTGGTTTLRSYSGAITIAANTIISSTATTPGSNDLVSCSGVTNNGTITPADANGANDTGQCATSAPTALFADATALGLTWGSPGVVSWHEADPN